MSIQCRSNGSVINNITNKFHKNNGLGITVVAPLCMVIPLV